MIDREEGPLKERRAGLVVSKNAVQLYHVTQYGLEPDDVTETLGEWKMVTLVDDYDVSLGGLVST